MKRYLIATLAVIVIAGSIITALFLTKPSADNAVHDPIATQVSEESSPAAAETEAPTEAPTEPPTEAPTIAPSYMIEGVEVIPQIEFKAGCETYACTMLLQSLGFDMDEHLFLDNYLEIRWPYWGDDGNRYGPDMYSSQTGDIYRGWGIYSTAMAKCMNQYLSDVGSDMRATAMEGVTLPELCERYICKGVPVMVWATTWMMEPYPKDSWIVDYYDPEVGKTKPGETFTWLQNEHCLVLIGYDEDEYYFADSCHGAVSHFDRELCELRYEQLGTQSIVVQ